MTDVHFLSVRLGLFERERAREKRVRQSGEEN